MPRRSKKPRRLIADGLAYLWTLRHSHRVLDGGRSADCRETLTLYPQPAGTGGPLCIVFAEGPTRTAMKPRGLGEQHAPIWWTDGIDQAVPSHLRLRRT